MISIENKNIAQWVMEFALKNGCSSARVSVIVGNNSSFEYRNTQLDKLHQSTENKLYIELYVDGRYGAFSTNRIVSAELEKFILDGILSTRYLSPDLCRVLPDIQRCYRGKTSNELDLFDTSFSTISTEQKIELAKQTVEEVLYADPRIVSVTASYDDGCGAEYMIASNGFESESSDTGFSITAEVALKTEGDARPEAYWYDSTIYWEDLKKKGVASKALDRALRKLGQEKIRSGKYSMLLDNTISSKLLSPLISAMLGSGLQQKNSFLLDKIGTQIVSPKLTIMDMPHLPRSFGARRFDGEGVATQERKIIDKGVLQTYFIDTYNGLKMGVEPTISSPSILVPEIGSNSFDELLKIMNNGIWVTGLNGGNCNPTTGDFSFGIEGFWVKNGMAEQPISEMNITGNMLVLWNNLVAIGNDPRVNSSWRIPSTLFHDVSFSGY